MGTAGLLYDNGDTDASNGYSNATVNAFGSRRTVLDDFVLSATAQVEGLSWTHVWGTGAPPPFGSGAEVQFRADAGGAPGAVTAVANVTSYSEVATGSVFFSRPEARSCVAMDAIPLAGGVHYWLEATVVGPDNNFWLVRSGVTGSECWVNYDDLGGLQPGSTLFGVQADLNFQLLDAGCGGTPPGIRFSQIDFVYDQAQQTDSAWGHVEVDTLLLTAATGIPEGYLNVRTPAGWVVQNVYVDTEYALLPLCAEFDLGNVPGTDVTTLSTYVEFTADPTVDFPGGSPATVPVGDVKVNAEGGEDPVTSIPDPPAKDRSFDVDGETLAHMLENWASEVDELTVQAAEGQCAPCGVADSLQYLKLRHGLEVPHEHKQGIHGDDSLVGQLDEAMDRKNEAKNGPPTRADGSGLKLPQILKGKWKYLKQHELLDSVDHSHQGDGLENTGNSIPANQDYTDPDTGETSKDESDQGEVTWEWICEQIQQKKDVEIMYRIEPKGAHFVRVVGCGKTKDRPWIAFLNDRLQSDEDPDDEKGLEVKVVELKDTDGDGKPNLGGSAKHEVEFALAECSPPAPGDCKSSYCDPTDGHPNNTASIDITTCDASSPTLEVTLAGGPPNQFCYLLVGDGSGVVSQPPGAKGDLCIVGGTCLGRYDKDVGKITAGGTFTTDIQNAASSPCQGGVLIAPGTSWNFQYWHRQPQGQPATFSGALSVTFE